MSAGNASWQLREPLLPKLCLRSRNWRHRRKVGKCFPLLLSEQPHMPRWRHKLRANRHRFRYSLCSRRRRVGVSRLRRFRSNLLRFLSLYSSKRRRCRCRRWSCRRFLFNSRLLCRFRYSSKLPRLLFLFLFNNKLRLRLFSNSKFPSPQWLPLLPPPPSPPRSRNHLRPSNPPLSNNNPLPRSKPTARRSAPLPLPTSWVSPLLPRKHQGLTRGWRYRTTLRSSRTLFCSGTPRWRVRVG